MKLSITSRLQFIRRVIVVMVLTLILTLKGCLIFDHQANYIGDLISGVNGNPCFNSKCDLQNALQLLALTKPKWKGIIFEDDGIKELHEFFTSKFPNVYNKYEEKFKNKSLSQEDLFKVFITETFDYLTKSGLTLNSRTSQEKINWFTRWLLGDKQNS